MTAKCLHLIGKAAAYLRTSHQHSTVPTASLALELLRAQADYKSTSLRALVFQTVQSIIQTPECKLEEDALQMFLTLFLRALENATTAEPAGSKFSLQVDFCPHAATSQYIVHHQIHCEQQKHAISSLCTILLDPGLHMARNETCIRPMPRESELRVQVLSVCCLAPITMNGTNTKLPSFPEDYGPLFLKTASSVIQYVHRSASFPVSTNQKRLP